MYMHMSDHMSANLLLPSSRNPYVGCVLFYLAMLMGVEGDAFFNVDARADRSTNRVELTVVDAPHVSAVYLVAAFVAHKLPKVKQQKTDCAEVIISRSCVVKGSGTN